MALSGVKIDPAKVPALKKPYLVTNNMRYFLIFISIFVLSACMQTRLDTSSLEAFDATSTKVMEEFEGTAAEKRELRRVLSQATLAFGVSEVVGLFGEIGASKSREFEESLNFLEGKSADDLLEEMRKR